nr:hypothetical protein [uncultured Holophaga sp.]
MEFFDLGRTQNIVKEATGLEVTHFYDDLVFVDHSAFLIQFDRKDLKHFTVHFNMDCPPADRIKLFSSLHDKATKEGLTCNLGQLFTLEQVEDKEEIQILFAGSPGLEH